MAEDRPGPQPGSEGARRIAEAHRGSHEHDREGGFAANPALAREAGRKGGEIVKQRYGPSFYQEIGRKGGETVKKSLGAPTSTPKSDAKAARCAASAPPKPARFFPRSSRSRRASVGDRGRTRKKKYK